MANHAVTLWKYQKGWSNRRDRLHESGYSIRNNTGIIVRVYQHEGDKGEGEEITTLICDAVNNTVGKGIDPNAVEGLLIALKSAGKLLAPGTHPSEIARSTVYSILIKAIKSAELK